MKNGAIKLGSRVRTAAGIFLLVLADLSILAGTVLSSMAVRRGLLPHVFHLMPPFAFRTEYCWLFPCWLAVLAYNGAYTRRFTFWDEVRALWKVTFIVSITIFAILFIGKAGAKFSRSFLLGVCLLSLVFFPVFRPPLKRLIYRLGFLKRKLLILGGGKSAMAASRTVRTEKNLGYEVAGFVDGDATNGGSIDGMKVHRFLDSADRYIERCGIHDVMIAEPGLEKERLASLINRVQRSAENTLYMSDISAVSVLGAELRHFGSQEGMVVEIKNNLLRPQNYIVKRLFDLVLGLAFSVAAVAPFLLIWLLVKATSEGPGLFRQQRLGRGGRLFRCYKFRTMYGDADERLGEILDADPESRRQWETYCKLKDDPRVTMAGRFLRETSLDELPQFINVLKGQMSLVGPRPYLEREMLHLRKYRETIHRVLPGITGLWQISGRSGTTFRERLAIDEWYVRNWNLWLDIVILFKTVKVVWTGQGAG